MACGGRGDLDAEDDDEVDSSAREESEDDYSEEDEGDFSEESEDESSDEEDCFPPQKINPRCAAEEEWERQIMEQMKFSVSSATKFLTMWNGSLHVNGPCQSLDPNLISMENFMPQLKLRRKKTTKKKKPCRRAIQVFGLNVSSPDDVVQEVYGMFAFRDIRNSQERNFIFEYPRERPFTLKPDSDKVQPIIQPPRGIYAVGPVLMEYHLMIKGQEEKEDRVLVDGYSMYCPSFYEELSRFHWHIDTGHSGAVDLKMAAVPNAVLATMEIEVLHLGGTHYDSLAVVAAFNMYRSQYLVFDGKVSVGRLQPITVSINRDRYLRLFLYGYSSSHIGHDNCAPDGLVSDYECDGLFYDEDGDDVYYDTLDFSPLYGSCKNISGNLQDMDVSVVVTWSSLYY